VDERAWAAFGAFKAGITGHKGESAVALALAGLGYSALHDVLLADLFGLTQVDHLVRGPDCILVIETKRYGGQITGSLRGDVWMQHLAGGEVRYSFRNPIRQNHRHCRAVEAVLAELDVPVGGYVVSAGVSDVLCRVGGRGGAARAVGGDVSCDPAACAHAGAHGDGVGAAGDGDRGFGTSPGGTPCCDVPAAG
jgi:hypothetical protein